ncbi:hypothetical protein CRUP_011058 [Coryphaenoides rupestris]|nr:hypothetical protein CRUP_011058 [Coryphaenoides rupestris]
MDNRTAPSGDDEDEDASPPTQPDDDASVADVSVEVATVDHEVQKTHRKYNHTHHHRRQRKRKRKSERRKLASLWLALWSYPYLVVVVTAVVFVVVVITWSLLWVFTCTYVCSVRRDSNNGVYFAGMIRVANVEFIPEYRRAESTEFVSMAKKIEVVLSNVYKLSSMAKLYKQTVISDLSNNNLGGVLVHFWMVFQVPHLKTSAVCEDCVGAILRDSVLTSLQNRTSVGYLLGLPVDIESILINSASPCVDKLHAPFPGASIPLSLDPSGGGVTCHIKLTSVPGSVVRLTVGSFFIQPSDCVRDALTVYNALLPMRGRTLHRVCDPVTAPLYLVSTSNVMLLSFRLTPGNKSFRGHFEAVPEESEWRSSVETPSPSLGVSLKFLNYVLRPKDIKPCEHGWWKVNQLMYVMYAQPPFQAAYGSYNIDQPCAEGHFLCSTGFCVEPHRRCDGLDDCQDESDEHFCSKPSKNCSGPVHPVYVCNGESDCSNGRDELNCTQETSCSGIRHQCRSDCGLPAPVRKVASSSDLDRIVGGVNSVEGEWPWQVGMLFSGSLYCGASVLSADWLISAAHCFSKERLSDPRSWRAHLGMLAHGGARHVAEIQHIVVHEYYDPGTLDYDVALLRLRRPWPASLAPLVQPVCLPTPSHTLTPQHPCWVTGWGYRSDDGGSAV